MICSWTMCALCQRVLHNHSLSWQVNTFSPARALSFFITVQYRQNQCNEILQGSTFFNYFLLEMKQNCSDNDMSWKFSVSLSSCFFKSFDHNSAANFIAINITSTSATKKNLWSGMFFFFIKCLLELCQLSDCTHCMKKKKVFAVGVPQPRLIKANELIFTGFIFHFI